MQIPVILEYLTPGGVLAGMPTIAWLIWKGSARFTHIDSKIDALDGRINDVKESVSELRADVREAHQRLLDRKGGF